MKIIHCADLHIDSKMESNFSQEQAKTRKEELLRAYEEMVQFAVSNEVKVIIIAGDLFDKTVIGKRAKNRVLSQMIEHKEIDFIYLRGNHDNVNLLEGVEEEIPNLRTFNADSWTKYAYDNIEISGIEINQSNHSTIYDRLILDKNKINIVTLHGQESQYKKDKTEVINLSRLKNKYIDYLALGHIHQYKRERLDDRGVYCYSGCIAARGFDECGVKGFVLLDVTDEGVKDTFVEVNSKVFHEIKVDVSDVSGIYETRDVIERIKKEVSDIPNTDVVKIILTGYVDIDTDIDEKQIVLEFEDRFYFMKLYNWTKIKIDYNLYENDISLKGEFVRTVKGEDLDEELKSRIIEIGLKALKGEEIEL